MARSLMMITAALLLCAGVAQATSNLNQPNHPAKAIPLADPVEEASASASTTGNESIVTATASCPPGTKAAGGGFDAPSSVDGIGLVYESVKVRQHSWRASAQLLDFNDPSTLTLTTYVYCRSHYPVTKTGSMTKPTSGTPGVGPTASANCPDGTVALAGGFHMPPPLQMPTVTSLFFDSLRDGAGGWDARVVTGPAGPSSFTSEAYCGRHDATGKHDDVPDAVIANGAPNAADFSVSTTNATCPAGLSPADGGFAQPDSDLSSFFFLFQSRRNGSSWQVSGLHSGAFPPVTLRSAAYCA